MVRTEDWYAQNGFSPDAARYFAGGVRKIASVAAGPDYTLVLVFDNGERRILDCKPEFGTGSLFNALRSPADFARVFLDENGNVAWDLDPSIDSSVHWENRIDICRDACYLRSVPAASAPCRRTTTPVAMVVHGAPSAPPVQALVIKNEMLKNAKWGG